MRAAIAADVVVALTLLREPAAILLDALDLKPALRSKPLRSNPWAPSVGAILLVAWDSTPALRSTPLMSAPWTGSSGTTLWVLDAARACGAMTTAQMNAMRP